MMTSDGIHDATETVEIHDEKSDHGKLSVLLGILKRFIGVKDISAVRLSLPAQLVEPIGNLEYWNYLDRPDYFASIGESEDPVDRMLEIIRFWYTKDLKYVKGKVCKPYNSILGEFFRCKWDVQRLGPDERPTTATSQPGTFTRSNRSIESVTSSNSTPILSRNTSNSSRSSTVQDSNAAAPAENTKSDRSNRVVFLTEQVLHHPPVSAFYGECKERGLVIRGYDQIAARFTGTSVKVGPGEFNKGIFITLKQRDNEEYHMTHPTANITGFISLKVHPYVTSWIHKARFQIEGTIFRYDPKNDTIDKLKAIPKKDVLINIVGSWRGKIYYSKPDSKHRHLLVDLEALDVEPKDCPPTETQLPLESRNVWTEVTAAIHAKEFSKATRVKQSIEARQRKEAALRKERGEEWIPTYFLVEDNGGRAMLTVAGREMLESMVRSGETIIPRISISAGRDGGSGTYQD